MPQCVCLDSGQSHSLNIKKCMTANLTLCMVSVDNCSNVNRNSSLSKYGVLCSA